MDFERWNIGTNQIGAQQNPCVLDCSYMGSKSNSTFHQSALWKVSLGRS